MEEMTQQAAPAPAAESSASLKTVKKIDWKSAAKIQAVILAFFYGLAGALATIGGLIGLVFGGDIMTLLGGVGLLVAGVIGGLIIGWLSGAIGAGIYNVAAGKVGGIKVDIS